MNSPIIYPEPIEQAIESIESWLDSLGQKNVLKSYSLSPRSLALLLLQKDPAIWRTLAQDFHQQQEAEILLTVAENQLEYPLDLAIAETRQKQARNLEAHTIKATKPATNSITEILHQLMVNPLTGFPILMLVLYFGVYKFVGEFGAGELVDRIEGFFEGQINPIVNHIVAQIIPWQPIQDLIGNDYGIITLGIRYATAIVLPIVATYFLMFSFLEDSGYLPRMSLMLDRLFKTIGLSGRAVIPMVLGLGCDTMHSNPTANFNPDRRNLFPF